MTGGSFPRSFLIPGTDTSIRVGGEVRTNALYWINGGNPNPHTPDQCRRDRAVCPHPAE